MQKITWKSVRTALGAALIPLLLSPQLAQAVPSFARQTGQNCVACHAGGQFPELTPYGRMFKLTGYTIGSRALPLSAMAVASLNKTKNTADLDPASIPKDGNLMFATASLFLAGKITDNLGGFVQYTYNNYDTLNENGKWVGHSSSDNLDLRYVERFIDINKDFIVGVTMNNNPTVQDVWNSVPAWGYNSVPGSSGPVATPLLAGGLAQNVAGIGAYAYWNQTLYAELAGYRTADGFWSFMSHGINTAPRGDQQIVKGTNPYWRLAVTKDWGAHSAMFGTFGMDAKIYPDALNPTGATNHFRDSGLDAQYQYILDPHAFTSTVSYIRERINYADSVANQPHPLDPDGTLGLPLTNASDTLKMFRAKASYVYRAKYGGTLSYFDVTGSANSALQTSAFDPANPGALLDSSEKTGNLSGNPATRGWTTEVFWTPVQNARMGLQYTMFNKFNGASSNYDGFGRNAKDNNTMFLYVWGAY